MGLHTNSENRSIFGEAMNKSLVSRFFDSICTSTYKNDNTTKKTTKMV